MSDHHDYDLSGSEELVALRGVFLFSIYCRDHPKYPTRTRWTRFFWSFLIRSSLFCHWYHFRWMRVGFSYISLCMYLPLATYAL